MRTPVLKAFALAAVLVVAAPALAGEPRHYPRSAEPGYAGMERGEFRLKLGLFDPRGDSNFWDDNKDIFTGDVKDLQDALFGADVLWTINPNLSLMFEGEYFDGSTTQFYRDPSLSDLGHESSLSLTPLKVGVVVYPVGRRAPVVPYLGAGGGLYWWRYREAGQFFNFDTSEVTSQTYGADGVVAGYFLLAGLDIPVRPYWSFFVEGQWQQLHATLNGDFAGFGDLDLSGTELSAGFAWRF